LTSFSRAANVFIEGAVSDVRIWFREVLICHREANGTSFSFIRPSYNDIYS
jgi:hypothetical protein